MNYRVTIPNGRTMILWIQAESIVRILQKAGWTVEPLGNPG
jgi:hypothetical protein